MKKEKMSLQEATQRALLEGYENLKENKLKKVEDTSNKYYYEIHFDYTEESGKDSDGYSKFFKSAKDVEDDTEYITNLAKEENILDEDDLADLDFVDYAQKIDKDEYEKATGKKEENKSKKVEAKLEDIQMEIYEMIQTARKVDKQDKDTNIHETIYAMNFEYPEINKKELSDYVKMKADEIYAGDYDEKTESKKVEGKTNVVSVLKKLNVSSFEELRDEIEEMLEKEIINEEYEDFLDIISDQEEACEDYIRRRSEVTNTDWEDEIGIESDYVTGAIQDLISSVSLNESKKVEGKKLKVVIKESKDITTSPDYLAKAFEVEVEYWLKALVDEDSNDEIGKKAQEVLDDKNKMREIVNELVDGSDDLWEDIHRRIEELAGLHYRESSRVNESKKVTEGLMDSVADYIILRDYNDYKSNDPWQELFVFDHKLSDDEKSKIQKAIDEAKQVEDYDNEIVEQKIDEVVPYVSNEILSFDDSKIFYF